MRASSQYGKRPSGLSVSGKIVIQLVGETTEEIKLHFERLGLPGYRGKQVAEWIYRRALPGQGGGASADFGAMTDLPLKLRGELSEQFALAPMATVQEQRDSSDGTIKIVCETRAAGDGLRIESVLMPDERRVSVCLSSQAGCPMACTFCATGTQGLARNLTVGEIIGQFLLLQELSPRPITHIVFMGQGEPLLNLPAVLKAIHILHGEIGLSMRHITVSTVGIVPAMRKLAEADLPINLALSLHAPNDSLRRSIVPRHKDLEELIGVCRDYFRQTGREITFEYILLGGVNDSAIQARELVTLLRGFPSYTVNLIPYNSTDVTESFQRPAASQIREFRSILADAGLRVTQRKERGHEIAAACGQLVTQAYKPVKPMDAGSIPLSVLAPENSNASFESGLLV